MQNDAFTYQGPPNVGAVPDFDVPIGRGKRCSNVLIRIDEDVPIHVGNDQASVARDYVALVAR